jgi:hypothetical protein
MQYQPLLIHQTRLFAKRLIAMDKDGKRERVVAQRARKIIADLQSHPLHKEAECKRTRHGELRLNDCRKYDLSCGFRLIALKRDNRLIFTYIGSHDDCQRWIENNQYDQDDIMSNPVPHINDDDCQRKDLAAPDFQDKNDSLCRIDEYEEQLLAHLSDADMREIFQGLFKGQQATGKQSSCP